MTLEILALRITSPIGNSFPFSSPTTTPNHNIPLLFCSLFLSLTSFYLVHLLNAFCLPWSKSFSLLSSLRVLFSLGISSSPSLCAIPSALMILTFLFLPLTTLLSALPHFNNTMGLFNRVWLITQYLKWNLFSLQKPAYLYSVSHLYLFPSFFYFNKLIFMPKAHTLCPLTYKQVSSYFM